MLLLLYLLGIKIGNYILYILCCCRESEDQTPQMTAMSCQNMPVFIQMKLRYTKDKYNIYMVSLPEIFQSCKVTCIYDDLSIL